MKTFILAFLFVSLCSFAQHTYTISHSTTLSASGTALSVQLPATGSNFVEVVEATVGLRDGACQIQLERNGAAASGSNATAATIVALDPETTPADLDPARGGTPHFTAWYGANIPAGTAVSPPWKLPAGAIMPFGSQRRMTSRSGMTSNYILRIVSPCTGTVDLNFVVRVRR